MRISDWSSDVCSSDLALAIDRECGNDDDHLGQGIVIRDGHVNLRLHTRWRHFRQALRGSPRQRHGRLAARKVDYPEVAPVDSLPRNAGSQGLGAGLLGGKSLGIARGSGGPPIRLLALDLRENPLGEAVAEALQSLKSEEHTSALQSLMRISSAV